MRYFKGGHHLLKLLSLVILLVSTLLPGRIMLVGMAIFVIINTISRFSYNTKSARIFNSMNLLQILFGIFFLIHFVSLLWTLDLNRAFKGLETKLSMILLPIAFNVFDLKIGKIDKVFLTYSVCMSLLLMVCFGIAIINAFHYGDFQTWPFKYYNFTYAVGFHPSYLTTLILISIIVILQLLHHQRYLILCFILLLIQIFSILFIGSRYGIFTLAAILTFQLVYVLYCKIHWAKINTLLVALVLTSIAIAGMILSKNSMTRLADSNEAIKDRLKIFEIGIDKIMDRPWVGGGVGSDRKLLLPEYRKKGLAVAFEEKYNLHNQFLQTSLELGLLGLAIFIILLFYFIICSQQKWLALQILFVFCMFFLVESVLERQSGVVSFTVWGMILSLKGPPDKVQRND